MAVRGPGRAQPGGHKGPPLSPLAQSLLSSGIAKTPAEARVMARALASALKQGGFPTTKKGDAGVKDQVAKFQAAGGLNPSGKLDAATVNKLVDAGVLPESARGKAPKADAGAAKQAGVGQKAKPDLDGAARVEKQWGNFQKEAPAARGRGGPAPAGERKHVVAHQQTQARAELTKDGRPKDLTQLLSSLATLGFFGGGKGKDRLANALRALQGNAGLPVTGKLDQATVKELVTRGVLPEGTEVPADKGGKGAAQTGGKNDANANARSRAQAGQQGAPSQAAARGNASASASAQQARADTAQGQQTANSRGVAEGTGDPNATQGQAGEGQGTGALGQGGQGVPHGANVDGGRARDGDADGEEDDDANAHAGDDDLADPERGHANRDDASDDEAGYWKVPSLTEQVLEALENIVRDRDEKGAATYSWDVTFLRPGVYGAGQPAEPLWHVVVERAGAFDPVWGEAQRALYERIADTEPEGAPPTEEDFVRALRKARVREDD